MAVLAGAISDALLAERVAAACEPVSEDDRLDSLIAWIGNAEVVLIGEATHGTHEFYQTRAKITERLIEEKGFHAVLAEADWPDAYRVNRFVRGLGNDQEAVDALGDFKRFPTWMWRNSVVLDFVGWLRERNLALPAERRAGFYGMDLYSLYSSMEAVVQYLESVDPDAASEARQRYACFDQYSADPQSYGYLATWSLDASCRDEVIKQLIELRVRATDYLRRDGMVAEDEQFAAEQNARVAKNAEAYYRTMFEGRVPSWNLRDQHMVETLEALRAHFGRQGRGQKIVVWAHNSHLGDARATEVASYGELNVGQLVREHLGRDCYLIGLTTYNGTVSAASEWDGSVERKTIRPAVEGSVENVFHGARADRFLLNLHETNAAVEGLREKRLERFIGVIYMPRTERLSHYFDVRLSDQYDAVIHIDHTRAVEPLERGPLWPETEVPETYPTGL